MIERLLVLGVIAFLVIGAGLGARAFAERKRRTMVGTVPTGITVGELPRVVSFYGPSCDACERQKLELKRLEASRPDRVAIELHDATVEYDYAQRFGLMIVPTTVIIDPAGTIRGINSGFTSLAMLETQLDAA